MFSIFFPSTSHNVAVRRKIGRNLEFSPLIFVRGHFQEIGIAAFPLGLKPRHVESFENVGWRTSEKVSWQMKKKKHEQNIRSRRRTGDLIM